MFPFYRYLHEKYAIHHFYTKFLDWKLYVHIYSNVHMIEQKMFYSIAYSEQNTLEQKMFYSIAYSEQNTHVTTDWTNSC